MTAPPHCCPVPGCTVRVPRQILLCRTHWRLVSRRTQAAVYRTWNGGRPTTAYLAVREQAVQEAASWTQN
jgi:hypothetical protein